MGHQLGFREQRCADPAGDGIAHLRGRRLLRDLRRRLPQHHAGKSGQCPRPDHGKRLCCLRLRRCRDHLCQQCGRHHCKCLWGKSEQWQLRRWQLCPAGRRPHHLWGYRSGYRDPVHVPDGDADHRTVRVPGVHCTHRPRSRLELGPLRMGLHGRLGPSALSSRPAAPSGPRLRPRIRPGLWPRPPQ